MANASRGLSELAELFVDVVIRVGLVRAKCRAAGFTYISSVNSCYKVVTRNLKWLAAEKNCRSLHKDAHLLIINNAQEQAAIADMLSSVSGQYLSQVFSTAR